VTELRGITGGAVKWVAVLGGYTNRGDGGGGVFFWDSTAAVDDGGTILNSGGLGANTAGWRRIFTGSLNVKWFGAKGDLSAADDPAIQQAIKVATGFDPTVTKPSTGWQAFKAGSIFFPLGSYKITSTLLFVGNGIYPFRIVGEIGNSFGLGFGGTVVAWYGKAGGTMFELRGLAEALVENVDFDGRLQAGICMWMHSNESNGGGAADGNLFRRCSFLNVLGGPSSVCFLVGDPAAGSEVDNSCWDHCSFMANQQNENQISAAACWQTGAGANTKNFTLYDCRFGGAQYGIDWQQNSGCLTVESCHFSTFGLPSWTTATDDAACIRAGNGGNTVVRACEVECNPDLLMPPVTGGARFITVKNWGASPATLTVEGCSVFITMPSDNMILKWGGPMTLIGNSFFGGWGNASTNQNVPHIGCGQVYLSSTNTAPATVFSLNNFYPFIPTNGYAPLVIWVPPYDALTGPGSWGAPQRLSVWSIGDYSSVGSNNMITGVALQPWFGTMPNAGASVTLPWNPSTIANGAIASTSTTMQVVNPGDAVIVSYTQTLPAGAILTAAVSGASTVTATLLNMTGSPLSPSGNLIFTAWPRT
jgi:hypothetical protein